MAIDAIPLISCIAFSLTHCQPATKGPPMHPMTEQIYDLYSRIYHLAAAHDGDWVGSDVVDIVSEWFEMLGLQVDFNQPMTTPAEFAARAIERIAVWSR